jgi:hypothetical protein
MFIVAFCFCPQAPSPGKTTMLAQTAKSLWLGLQQPSSLRRRVLYYVLAGTALIWLSLIIWSQVHLSSSLAGDAQASASIVQAKIVRSPDSDADSDLYQHAGRSIKSQPRKESTAIPGWSALSIGGWIRFKEWPRNRELCVIAHDECALKLSILPFGWHMLRFSITTESQAVYDLDTPLPLSSVALEGAHKAPDFNHPFPPGIFGSEWHYFALTFDGYGVTVGGYAPAASMSFYLDGRRMAHRTLPIPAHADELGQTNPPPPPRLSLLSIPARPNNDNNWLSPSNLRIGSCCSKWPGLENKRHFDLAKL